MSDGETIAVYQRIQAERSPTLEILRPPGCSSGPCAWLVLQPSVEVADGTRGPGGKQRSPAPANGPPWPASVSACGREKARLLEERNIVTKAAAFFSRESPSDPPSAIPSGPSPEWPGSGPSGPSAQRRLGPANSPDESARPGQSGAGRPHAVAPHPDEGALRRRDALRARSAERPVGSMGWPGCVLPLA